MKYRQCSKCRTLCNISDIECQCGYKFKQRSDHKEHIKITQKTRGNDRGEMWGGDSAKELRTVLKRERGE